MQALSSQHSRRGRFAGFGLLVGLLAFGSLWPTLASAQHTSAECPPQIGSVSSGGTVTINISDCASNIAFAGIGDIDGGSSGAGDFEDHGTATTRITGGQWFLDYSHNGTTGIGSTDVFEITEATASGNGDVLVTITINPSGSPITVLPAALPTLTAGSPFSQTLTSSGGLAPYSYTLQSGVLPVGVSLTSGGVLSGTPTQRGAYSFSVRSTDATTPTAQFVDRGYTGTVQNPSLAISPATGTAIQGVPFSQTLAITGGVAPHLCQLETGTFPAGISVSSACVISGTTAAAPGNFPVTIRVTDSSTGPGTYFEVESFTLTVSPPPSVSIAVAPASVSEDGATNLTYTVTRSLNLSSPTTVNISTGGTATSGVDYTGGVATVVIPSSATTATVTIDPTVDGTVEADETVTLTVAAGTGYSVGVPSSATATILNDDVPTATIAVAPAAVAEDGAPNLVYTVTLNQASFSALNVGYTVGGTATNGTDYATITPPLVIAAGSTTGTVTVNPTTDATIEADETVILTLAAGAGYIVGVPNAATGTILNDDLPNLSINDVTLAEGNAGTTNFTFTASLTAPAGPGGVTFDIATANGTATAGTDYVANTLAAQTIPAGTSTYTFTVQATGDALNEANETFFVNVTNVVNAVVVDGQGIGTITNDDPQPSLSIDDVTVVEGNAGTTNAVFTVALSAASGQTVTVSHATADGTATAGADYTATTGTTTIAAGSTTQTITVPILGDTTPEANETFVVNLSAPTNATIGNAQGTGTITDDDTTLSIGDVTVTEGNAGTTTATFTVTLSQPAGVGGASFDIATSNGTATAGTDYVARALTAQTIAAGGTTFAFAVTVNGDTLDEPDETFNVTVSNLAGASLADGVAVGTIADDDPTPALSIGNVTVTEGNAGTTAANFTVTLGASSGQTVTVNFATADGTATAGSDYVATAGTLSFAPGITTQPVAVTINGDIVPEGNETFSVNLSAPTNAVIGAGTGTGTITNDDAPVVVAPTTLPNATVAAAYSQTITASGGNGGPYTFAVTAGALPAGLTLGATGALTGTPTAGGTFNFTVTATDGSPAPGPFTGTQVYTLVVNPPTLVLPPTTLPGGTTGVVYTATLNPATGGTAPYAYAVTAGALPAGIAMSATGAFTGTPTAAGSFTFTVTATDSSTGTGPYTIARPFTIDVAAIVVDPATLPNATAGAAYSQTLTASGGTAPYAFNVSAGALPAGLALSTAGVLSGTPTASGTFNFTVRAVDSATRPGTRPYTLVVAVPTLSITPATLPGGAAGTAYSQALTATGGNAPYAFTVSAGALPAGLALSAAGVVSGTPSVAGTFNFTATVTDATSGTAGTASQPYTLVLTPPNIVVNQAALPTTFIGVPYSVTLTSSGGTAPYTYAVTTGTLPPGLTLTPAGVLSGTPTSAGTFTFTITSTDALGFTGTRAYSLVGVSASIPVNSPWGLALMALLLAMLGGFALRRRRDAAD
jgi:hypothetical protein